MAKASCTACGHKKREEIDKALVNGVPLRNIAKQFGISLGAVQRHKTHLSRNLVKALAKARDVKSFEAKEVFRELTRGDSLLEDVRSGEDRAERLYAAAEGILNRALESQDKTDRKTALLAIRAAVDIMGEARQYMELRGELTGELSKVGAPSINVTLIRTLMVPRPDASKALPFVVDAVKEIDP